MFLVFLFMRFLYKFVISPSKGGDEKQLFHQFFCMITITNTMTNTESRDFVFIFSGKSLISNLIMVNCSEFTKLIIKFHLLLATQISGWRARCLIKNLFYSKIILFLTNFFSFFNKIYSK